MTNLYFVLGYQLRICLVIITYRCLQERRAEFYGLQHKSRFTFCVTI